MYLYTYITNTYSIKSLWKMKDFEKVGKREKSERERGMRLMTCREFGRWWGARANQKRVKKGGKD